MPCLTVNWASSLTYWLLAVPIKAVQQVYDFTVILVLGRGAPFLISSDAFSTMLSAVESLPNTSVLLSASRPGFTGTQTALLFSARMTNTSSVLLITADLGTINVLSVGVMGIFTSATMPGNNCMFELSTSISICSDLSLVSRAPASRFTCATNC